MQHKAPTAKIVALDKDSSKPSSLTFAWGGKPNTIRSTEKYFDRAWNALKNEDWDELYFAMNPGEELITTHKYENVAIVNGVVTYRGEAIHSTLADRILALLDSGLKCDALFAFLNKLMENPSKDSQNELYSFLEQKNIPICDDGDFYAYKGVQSNYYSITSGKAKLLKGKQDSSGHIFNGVGEEIEVERGDVDSNRNRGCSFGLHGGTYDYANGFKGSGKLVLVKLNPKDVVSVPLECSCTKLRTCAYKVVSEVSNAITKVVVKTDTEGKPTASTTASTTSTVNYHNLRDGKGRFIPKFNATKVIQANAVQNKVTQAVQTHSVKHSERDSLGRFTSVK